MRHVYVYLSSFNVKPSDLQELAQHYCGDLLIINVVFLEPRTPNPKIPMPADHLSVPDVERIITQLKPKVAILTHFGMSVWRAKPWKIAERLSKSTGVRVIASRDGMKFDLSQLDES